MKNPDIKRLMEVAGVSMDSPKVKELIEQDESPDKKMGFSFDCKTGKGRVFAHDFGQNATANAGAAGWEESVQEMKGCIIQCRRDLMQSEDTGDSLGNDVDDILDNAIHAVRLLNSFIKTQRDVVSEVVFFKLNQECYIICGQPHSD